MIGWRSSAATPVIPSPGRMRGRCAGSSKRVPCVARSSSMPDASSYRYTKQASVAIASATREAISASTSARSRLELTAATVSVSSCTWRAARSRVALMQRV